MSQSYLPRRLRTRLFLSYLVVVATGAITMLVVGTVTTRTVYERRVGRVGLGRQQGRRNAAEPVTEADLQTVLDESLLPALLIGTIAALVAAGLVAWLVGRRLLRPLEEVRDATRRMAAGDYDVRVPVPDELELASLAHDVNELGDHLASTERRRTQLLADVTHELRTPISVVQGQMEGILDGVIPAEEGVFVTVAGEASRMQRLVEDLDVLSRTEEGALDLRRTDLDLALIAADVVERLRPQFEHAGVDLRTTAEGDAVVEGDLDRVTQIVTNLLGNALGHTPHGGSVTVRVRASWPVGCLEVTDTGDGIDPEELDRIFDRFYRSPPAMGRRSGRGLGLTIARGLARAQGGDVVVESPGRGAGSTFRLTMPLVRAGGAGE